MNRIQKWFSCPIVGPLFIGLLFRLIFIGISNHIYYPDELYQTLEQAHHIVYGFGIVPWDIAYGLRTFTVPLMLTLPLILARFLDINDPAIYRYFPQIMLILLSLLPIIGVFELVRALTHNTKAAYFAAVHAAIWYELIYFASRALTELIAVDLYSLALILGAKKNRAFFQGCLISTALLIRPQYFPLAIILTFINIKNKKGLLLFLIGTGISILLFGLVDLYFLHSFFIYLPRYITVNLLDDISRVFGTQSNWFYLISLISSSGGLIIVSFLAPFKKSYPILMCIFALLFLHSLSPHKEYRFIILIIPLWISLISIFFANHFPKKNNNRYWLAATGIISIISILGILNRLPGESAIYTSPQLQQDPELSLYSYISNEPTVCGVFDSTRNWVDIPGYFYLHRNVPIYTVDYPPKNATSVSHLVALDPNLKLAGFVKVYSTESYEAIKNDIRVRIQGVTLYKTTMNSCEIDSSYSYIRSFPEVDQILNSLHLGPLSVFHH